MTTSVIEPAQIDPAKSDLKKSNLEKANTALNASAAFWFITALIGQWIFVYYLIAGYGGSAIQDGFESWNKINSGTFVAGDNVGNTAIGLHLLLAVMIMGVGPLQLIPKVRSIAPTFHRINGRIYLVTALISSIIGLYMIWTRGTVGGMAQHIGISLDAVLIIIFAGLTLRYAVARDLKTHRRWALRLFMVVSAVWFYRVGLMLWFLLTGGAGINMETFEGPFVSTIAFAQYLIPLAILELYLRAKDSKSVAGKFTMAISLTVLTLAMGVGVFVAFMGMWLPHL